MSPPLFLVPWLPESVSFVLDGSEGHHAANVQRLRVGEELILGDGRGGTAAGVVKAVGKASLEILINNRGYQEQLEPRLTVAQGIAKGDRGELAVQAMTEVGVDEILPWAAGRSVVQWRGDRGARSREKWVMTAREAAKQSRRAWLPMVGGSPDISSKALAKRLSTTTSFVLHEEAATRLSAVELPASGELIVVVGPEGGIEEREVAMFVDAGAVPVRLGDSVLRTSTAGVAALCLLATRLRRW